MSGLWSALRRFWETDRSLSLLLIVLVLLVFVVPALGLIGAPGRALLDVLFTLLIVAGAGAVSARRGATAVVVVVGLGALAIRGIGWFVPTAGMDVAASLSSSLGIAAMVAVTLAQVLRSGPVNRHRILGAIAVYLLLGLMWGFAYDALSRLQPEAFSIGAANPQSWMYFSFVTLTTTGFGDITPVAPVARSLTVLEAMTGQLYVATLIARLVSLQVAEPHGR